MRKQIATFEELIMGMLSEAYAALHAGQDVLFDRVIESIEVTLKVTPTVFNEFQKIKTKLYREAQQNYQQSAVQVQQYSDEYYQQVIKERNDAEIGWSYRTDMLEEIIALLAKYNLIPFTNPDFAEIEPVVVEPQQPQPVPQQPQPQPYVEPSPLKQIPQAPPQQPQQQQQPQQPQQQHVPQQSQIPVLKEGQELTDDQVRQIIANRNKGPQPQQPQPENRKSKFAELFSK